MSIENSAFVVQRGDEQFSCLGSDLGDKLQDDDLLISQRGANHGSVVKDNIDDADLFVVTDGDNGHKSVTGAQVKGLFSESFPDPVLGGLIPGEIITVTTGQWKVGAYSWWIGQSDSGAESGNVTGVDVYCWPNGLDPIENPEKYATLKVLEVDQMYEDGGMRERTLPSKMEVQKCPHSGFDSGTNQFIVMENDGSISEYSSWTELTTDWPIHT